jgi:hypothetical protein
VLALREDGQLTLQVIDRGHARAPHGGDAGPMRGDRCSASVMGEVTPIAQHRVMSGGWSTGQCAAVHALSTAVNRAEGARAVAGRSRGSAPAARSSTCNGPKFQSCRWRGRAEASVVVRGSGYRSAGSPSSAWRHSGRTRRGLAPIPAVRLATTGGSSRPEAALRPPEEYG